MVVTTGARHGQAEPDGRGGFEPVGDVLDAVFLVDDAGFAGDHVIPIEAGGDSLGRRRIGQQVARKLLDRKLVERLVAVERLDDPVAPWPNLPRIVAKETVRIGVARGIEPVGRHAFAEVRRSEQSLHHPLVRVGPCIGQKRIQFLDRRGQASQVKRYPAQQRSLVGLGGGTKLFLLEPGKDKVVNFIAGPRVPSWSGWQHGDGRDKRPMRRVRGTFGDPLPQQGDLGRLDRLAGFGRRHRLVFVRDAQDQFAAGRIPRDDGDRT